MVLEEDSLFENLEEVKRSQADILILDACGPWGIEGVSRLTKLSPGLRVVVLMDDLDDRSCSRAIELGAWGCLSTREHPQTLPKALSAVSHGERWVPHQATREMIEDVFQKKRQTRKGSEGLTPREWEVLGLLANGFRNKEISSRLSISEETAKSHIKSIYRKLKIKGRQEVISRYLEYGRPLAGEEDRRTSGPPDQSSPTIPHKT